MVRKAITGLLLALSASTMAAQAGNGDAGRMIGGAMAEGACSSLELSVFATDSVSSVTDRDRESLSRCAWFAETKRQKAAGMSVMTFEAWGVRNPLLAADGVSDALWIASYKAYNSAQTPGEPEVITNRQ